MVNSIVIQELHKNGKTIIDYDENLNYVISGGTDGLIKVWSLSKNEIVISYSLQSGVKCIVSENERVFINAGNRVEMRSIVNQATSGYVFISFTSNVNDIQLNKNKTKLVSCSDDCNIKLINLDENRNDIKREILFSGHKGPVYSVSINCDDSYLASASCDGLLLIWDILTGKKLKSLEIFEKCADISNMKKRCKLKWHPNISKMLAITIGNEIRFVECDSFSIKGSLMCNEGELNDFTFNDEGNLLVGGTRSGWIVIWNTLKMNLLMKWRSSRKSEITSVIWPKLLNIIFSDVSGYWEMIEVILDQSNQLADNDFDNSSLTMDEINNLFDEEIVNDLEVSEDQDTTSVVLNSEKLKESVHNDSLDLTAENSEIDEDNEISLADLKAEYEYPMKKENISQQVNVSTTKIIREVRKPHSPVRSTLCPRNGNKQILMWNPIAALKNHFDDLNDYNCFLEVDFQDRAVNSNLIYRHNVIRYEMGDVNRSALMLVSKQSGSLRHVKDDDENSEDEEDEEDEKDDDNQPAVVHVRPLNSNSWHEWNIALPSNREKVIGCCLVGQIYAVVMTERYLRYFMANAGGLQANIESIHGTPVAIVSSSSYVITQSVDENFIRVVIVIDDGSKLVWRLELFNTKDQLVKWANKGKLKAIFATSAWHPLPLSQSSTLKWIGFSDSGALFTVDSKQSIRRLHIEIDATVKKFSEPRWTSVLNLKSALDKDCRSIDRYFPIGIMDREDRCCFLAVHCRDSRYPTVTPWQHLSMIDFRLPICGSTKSDLVELENGLLVNQLVADWTDSSSVSALELNEKQLLLKLFANAVLEDQDSRAFAIGKLMPDSQVIQLAIRYAARNNKKYLAEKMGELALQKDEETRLLAENVQESQVDEFATEPERKENVDPEIRMELNEEAIKVADGILTDNQTDEPILSKPFKNLYKAVVSKPVEHRGLQAIDEMVKNIPSKKSPIKDLNPFGKFSPSPCHQKFKVKTKRKSTRTTECPLEKAMKK